MRVYNRKLKILKELVECDDFLTSEFLSQKIKVSSRTIRDDVKRLGIDLEKENIEVLSISSKGYRIQNKDKDKALNYYLRRIEETRQAPTFPKNRIFYITKTILFAKKLVSIDELANRLIVSASTIEKDLVLVEKWLASQNVDLVKKSLAGIRVSGAEIARRYAMVNCLLEQQSQHRRDLLDDLTDVIAADKFDQIVGIIDNVQNINGFYLSDHDYKYLCIYLSIALMRISDGKMVAVLGEDIEKVKLTPEYKFASQMGEEIQGITGADFTQDEVISVAQYLLQVNLIFEDHSFFEAHNITSLEDIRRFINKTISDIQEKFSTDFNQDYELHHGLEQALRSLLLGIKHKIRVKTPSLEEIKPEYPNELEMAIMISKAIKREYQVELSEDEIGDFALYFCAASERKKIVNTSTPLRVIIICSSGVSGSQLLAVKIKRYFPQFIVDGVYPAHRLSEVRQKRPDFIISTIPLEEETIPFIQVSHIFNDHDFFSIHNFLNDQNSVGDGGNNHAFIKLFNPKLFFSGIELNQREEVIKLLCSELVEQGYADELFTTNVLEREALFSTAIGNLVAIPHALPGESGESQIVVGILKKPILWGKDKVQLVFLLNIQNTSEEEFAQIYEYFYDIIDSFSLIKNLIKTDRYDQFIQLIS